MSTRTQSVGARARPPIGAGPPGAPGFVQPVTSADVMPRSMTIRMKKAPGIAYVQQRAGGVAAEARKTRTPARLLQWFVRRRFLLEVGVCEPAATVDRVSPRTLRQHRQFRTLPGVRDCLPRARSHSEFPYRGQSATRPALLPASHVSAGGTRRPDQPRVGQRLPGGCEARSDARTTATAYATRMPATETATPVGRRP